MEGADRFASRQRVFVRGAILACGGCGLAVGIYILTYYPPTDASFYPKCQFHSLTGMHCPGCGVTRALHSLLNGHVEQAVAYNALAFVFLPYVAVAAVRSLWAWVWDQPLRRSTGPQWVRTRLPWVIAVVLGVFWVARNIPVYPFTLLAPHELTP